MQKFVTVKMITTYDADKIDQNEKMVSVNFLKILRNGND